ncbi:MAG: hypothetical protein LWW98_09880, partial [Deltaproteobacteria bacterium]|nr:hypothetical protein [Deltaproteobacteria bacterium]
MNGVVRLFSEKRGMGLLSGLLLAFMLLLPGYITSTVHAGEETVTHIYIDQAKGVNSSSTPGTEGEPFKS